MTTMQGIDISVYQGEPPISWWRQLRGEGWEVAVVGSWHGRSRNQYAETNLAAARREGFHTATYALLMDGRTGREQIQIAHEACGAEWEHLSFVAVDCEQDGITIAMIAEASREVHRLGQYPIIYTARWWWVDHFGDPHDFSHLPLWNAYYDQDPDIDFPSAPYGGWTAAAGEQYAGTTDLHGVDVDKNTFEAAFIGQEEDEMWKIIRAENGTTAYALIGAGKWKLPSMDVLNDLRAKGIAEPADKLAVMEPATVAAIPDVPAPAGVPGALPRHDHEATTTVAASGE